MWNWDESSVDSPSRKYASQLKQLRQQIVNERILKIGLSLENYHQSLCMHKAASFFLQKLYVIKASLLNKYEEWENKKMMREWEYKKGSCDDRRCSKLSKKIIKISSLDGLTFIFCFGYNANLEKWFLCAPTRGFSSWLPQFTLHST